MDRIQEKMTKKGTFLDPSDLNERSLRESDHLKTWSVLLYERGQLLVSVSDP